MRFTEETERRLLDDIGTTPGAHLVLGPLAPPRLGVEPYDREDGSILIYRDGLSERLHRYLYRLVVDPKLGRRRLSPTCAVWGCQNPRHFELTAHGVALGARTEPYRAHRAPDAARRNAKKRACPHGHPYTPENTYLWTDPQGREHRACRVCRDQRRERARGQSSGAE